MTETIKQKRSRAGKLGKQIQTINYIQGLIEELSKLVDKGRLNFYMEFAKNDKSGRMLREALDFHRNEKKQKGTSSL